MDRAPNIRQAVEDYGGFIVDDARGMTAAEVRAYFSRENFREMYGSDECDHCGGYSLADCAAWALAELGLS